MSDRIDFLGQLVRTHRRSLVAAARREGSSAEEALECVQDAVCTWLSRPDDAASDAEHTAATLHTMVRNAARNLRRRHHRCRCHAAEADALADDRRDAEALFAEAEDVVRLRVCVAELCEVQRAVVMLRLLEERSGEDVAQALGLRRNYVDVLVHRAKAALRVCMSAHARVGRTWSHRGNASL